MHLKKEIYHAAIYLRLSRDDEDKAESDSIQNQRELLKSFISKDPTLVLEQEFSDDGYTGTNFNRPGFQKMMELAEKEMIDCIIVKDLSRLGRNYIETGRYIDQIFPMIGLRFISVNDNYDSIREHNDADDIIIPFKNLINDTYCRDISMKIRSQLDLKRKNGQFIGSFAGYGYKKDPKDKFHLVVDEQAAATVRMIFNMKLEGYSSGRIADKLNEMGVLPPLRDKRSKGLNCCSGFWRGEESKWHACTVTTVLKNDLYLGTLSQGKVRKINYKLPKCQKVDRDDWYITPNAHEPIITQSVFDRVQELMQMDTRVSPDGDKVRLLAGFIKCAECGENMVIRTVLRGDKRYVYYTCSTNKAGRGCSSHLISAERVEALVIDAVQNQIGLLLEQDALLRRADELPADAHAINVLDEQLTTLEQEIRHYKELQEKLYVDFKENIIENDDYEELKERFAQKQKQAEESMAAVNEKKRKAITEPAVPMEWLDEIRSTGNVDKVTRKMLTMLVEKVIVHDKDNVEIIFRYGDEINYVLDYWEKVNTSVPDEYEAVAI